MTKEVKSQLTVGTDEVERSLRWHKRAKYEIQARDEPVADSSSRSRQTPDVQQDEWRAMAQIRMANIGGR